jgi:hypothetical protein
MPYQKWPLNKAGLPIMAPYRPAEQYCDVYDGIADNYKGIKFRRALFPSRLK